MCVYIQAYKFCLIIYFYLCTTEIDEILATVDSTTLGKYINHTVAGFLLFYHGWEFIPLK